MPLEGAYEPSPWDMIAEQVATFEASGGTEGNLLEGKPCIILWTRGRRSGNVRKTPLMRVEHDGSYAVVASKGGAPDEPKWAENMRRHPLVELQDGADKRDYTARELSGDERTEWWARATAVWPDYDVYQTKTDRLIAVFVVEPLDA
jgi:deazaflavin-dependent oxidoreductase (nitroreductase family)